MSHKIARACILKVDNSITDKCQDLINTNTLKSKEKYKDNKLAVENELNMKRSICQRRNIKTNKQTIDVRNMQNEKNIKTSEKSDNAKEKERTSSNENSIKYNAKEAKEKKNKEDTKNKNRGGKENDVGGNKETAMPFTRNKKQFSDQVHTCSAQFLLIITLVYIDIEIIMCSADVNFIIFLRLFFFYFSQKKYIFQSKEWHFCFFVLFYIFYFVIV